MAEEQNVFVKTLTDNLMIIDCTYPAASVVEVPASVGKRLIEGKFAEAHGGPASQPAAAAEGEHKEHAEGEHKHGHGHGEPLERQHTKTEKAVK